MDLQQRIILNLQPICGSMIKFRPPYYLTKEQVFDESGELKPPKQAEGNLDRYDIKPLSKEDVEFTSDGHVKINGPNPIPLPPDYKYIGGTVFYQSFPHVRSTEGRLLSTAEDIKCGPVHFDYQHYEIACLEHNIKRCWATYNQSLYNITEPFNVSDPAATVDVSARVNEISGYDRCLDCTYFLFVLNQLQVRLGGDKDAVDLILEVISQYNWKLCCMVDYLYSNQKILFHGLYSNLPQPERYAKYIDISEDMAIYSGHRPSSI